MIIPEPAWRYSSTFPWELEPGPSSVTKKPQGQPVALASPATQSQASGTCLHSHLELSTPRQPGREAQTLKSLKLRPCNTTSLSSKKIFKTNRGEGKNNWSKKQKLWICMWKVKHHPRDLWNKGLRIEGPCSRIFAWQSHAEHVIKV